MIRVARAAFFIVNLALPSLSSALEGVGLGPRIGQEGDTYVPGDLYPRSDAYERRIERERYEGIRDQLQRIEEMGRRLETIKRREWLNEYQQRHFPPAPPWERAP